MGKRDDYLLQLNRELGQIKEQISQLQKKQDELEAEAKKNSRLLDPLKPDFITSLQKHKMEISSLKIELDSVKHVQDTLIHNLTEMKKKLDFFDYENVVKINKEMREKMKKLEKINTRVEKNEQKMEGMFKEFEKNYVDFRNFKSLKEKTETLIKSYGEEFSGMRKELRSCAKEKDLSLLKEELKGVKKELKKKR